MNSTRLISLILITVFFILLCGCSNVDKNYGANSESIVSDTNNSQIDSLPKITSLDNEMAKYFDISLFDEENYADIYLGKKFEVSAIYEDSEFNLPTTMEEISLLGWVLENGSDYDHSSLIYAKETVELDFVNQNGAKITALFYNSTNSSVRLSKCNIVKFYISNNYFADANNFAKFNINGITNTSVVTDVIEILGTPSHFYKKIDNQYYFDYFLQKRDRRNKIRIYVDIVNDAVLAVEFANYK